MTMHAAAPKSNERAEAFEEMAEWCDKQSQWFKEQGQMASKTAYFACAELARQKAREARE